MPRLPVVHTLRGLASLAVLWFHMAHGDAFMYAKLGAFGWGARFGYLGVEVFFVISGFILPYALWYGKYQVSDYWRFVAKRIVRLDPPYFAAILIAIALNYLSALAPQFHGAPFSINFFNLLVHVGYLNAFFGQPWIIVVLWTLAIEFQFYLILGLIFPLLSAANKLKPLAVFAFFGALPFLFSNLSYFPKYFPLFLMGIAVFRRKVSLSSLPECLALLTVGFAWTAYTVGLPEGLAGLLGAVCILWFHFRSKITDFFGNISYSLYLLHVPIGGRVVNLLSRYVRHSSPFVVFLVDLLAAAVSIGSAYLLYRYVELPSQKWAAGMRYKRRTSAPAELSFEPMQQPINAASKL